MSPCGHLSGTSCIGTTNLNRSNAFTAFGNHHYLHDSVPTLIQSPKTDKADQNSSAHTQQREMLTGVAAILLTALVIQVVIGTRHPC